MARLRRVDANMWEEVFGSAEMLMEAAGARNIRLVVTKGGRDGDRDCDARATWQ